MKNLAKYTAVVMVLAAALTFYSTALVAAPIHGAAMAAEHSTSLGLIQTFLRLFGFPTGDAVANPGPHRSLEGKGVSATHDIGTSGSIGSASRLTSPGISTNTATWGGGRCGLPPC